jgi:HAE1 family hydrophobic/amphiphilic exporter-1
MKLFSGRKAFIFCLIAISTGVQQVSAQDDQQAVRDILQAVVVREKSDFTKPAAEAVSGESKTVNNNLLTRLGVQNSQTVPLTVAAAIAKALENNNTVEITRDDVRFQATQIRAIHGAYDPVFNISPTYTRNSTTGSAATNDFNVNSSMTHFIQPGGGNYTVFFNNNRTENAFNQAQLSSGSIGGSSSSASFFSSTGFRYTQPLLRNLGIDNTRRNLKIARKRLDQTDFDFRRTTIDTISQVQSSYWDLVFALRDQQNQQANLDLSRENLRQIQARIDAGAAAPIEKAEVETELATREGNVLRSTQQVSIAENRLKQIILRDTTDPEWSRTYIPTDAPVIGTTVVNLDAAMQDALNNRFELRRLKTDNEINQLDIRFFKNQLKPQIDFNTTISLDGFSRGGTNEEFTTNLYTSAGDLRFFNAINQLRAISTPVLLPIVNDTIVVPAQPSYLFGGFGRSFANLFRSDAPNFTFGLTISFPLRNETAKANLAGARIEENRIATRTRAQEQAVIVEVRNAVQAVETARQLVATSRRARESAELQLEGERRLFENGRSTTFLLFQRENTLTNARNAEIRAETDYQKALADLHRVTSVTLDQNNIQLDSPLDDN